MNEGNTPGRTELNFNPALPGATIPAAATSFPTGVELANGVTNGPTGTTVRLKATSSPRR